MKLLLLTCASTKEDWSEEAKNLYHKKISMFLSFEIKELKVKKVAREDRELKRLSDSQSILGEIKKDDFVVLFDEKGQSFESREFSKQIEKILNSGKKRLVCVIGGAYGVNEEVQKRANLTVSLSKMVFNHLVAQTVVLEQIYRSFAILKNLPYHND